MIKRLFTKSDPASSPEEGVDAAVSRQNEERRQEAVETARSLRQSTRPAPLPRLPAGAGVREEAAALYAAGSATRAAEALLTEINTTKGGCPPSLWYMLLDLYQYTNQQQAFEKLAYFFSSHFKQTPPAWDDSELPVGATSSGLNVLVVDGFLHAIHADKVREFVSAGRADHHARLDLSRARLGEDAASCEAGITGLVRLMARLRQFRVPTLLMGETQLAEQMRSAVAALSGAEARPYWLLLLEFLQWRGQREAFEDLAFRYAERFAFSPPEFEEEGVVALAPGNDPEPRGGARGRAIQVPGVIAQAEMTALIAAVGEAIRAPGSLRLDFYRVRSMTYEAASAWAAFLHRSNLDADRIVAVRPSELIVALMDIVGASGLITIEPRKR